MERGKQKTDTLFAVFLQNQVTLNFINLSFYQKCYWMWNVIDINSVLLNLLLFYICFSGTVFCQYWVTKLNIFWVKVDSLKLWRVHLHNQCLKLFTQAKPWFFGGPLLYRSKKQGLMNQIIHMNEFHNMELCVPEILCKSAKKVINWNFQSSPGLSKLSFVH